MSLRNFAEPVTLVRSPTFTNRLSSPMLKGSRPDSRHLTGTLDRVRAGDGATASRIRRIWSGVVPQQPPTILSSPERANSARIAAISSGVSSYSPKAFGRPAFGYAQT